MLAENVRTRTAPWREQAHRTWLQTDMATGVAYESEAFGLCFATEDQKDAMAAFLNKEKLTAFKNR